MVGIIWGKDRFSAGTKRDKKLWMVREDANEMTEDREQNLEGHNKSKYVRNKVHFHI